LRKEKDLLGERELPDDALYGIHTLRAIENFPVSGRRVSPALVHAFGAVKLACAKTNHELGFLDNTIYGVLEQACIEMMDGRLDAHLLTDALQGGAGTSTNMNVNEVLANRALVLLGKKPGDYMVIHPLEHVNLHQSTNDTYPTALKVAGISSLRKLEKALVMLLESFQKKEKELSHVVKVARTEMQDAVLTTLGRTMSAYAEAFGRDRWRVFKCEERLRVINLGGTAIGTGLCAPRKYIFKVTENLKTITSFGLARAENLVECTQNCDAFVEVSGILSACSSNLLKIAGDIRFMSSGPCAGIGEISVPARQAGSSIMPGKINPVIPECVSQIAIKVMSNHNSVSCAAAMGNLELNAFLPLIADSLLESIELLTAACSIFSEFCVEGIKADENRCRSQVESAIAAATALTELIGYEESQKIMTLHIESGKSLREITTESGIISDDDFNQLISPERVTRLGIP